VSVHLSIKCGKPKCETEVAKLRYDVDQENVTPGALMARRKSLRSQLYRGARDLGNLEAAKKGPTSLGKRCVRRAAYRKTNSGLSGLLRSFGLGGGRRR
jgi:hypothetical protein